MTRRTVPRYLYYVVVSVLLTLAFVSFPVSTTSTIQHIVVIVQENHSFDNLFGFYPGVNGLKNSTSPIFRTKTNSAYENQSIDGFVGHPQNYGYFTCADVPYYCALAQGGTLFDNYFEATPAPTLPNHMAMIAGSTLGFHTDWNTSGQAFPWRSNMTILGEMNMKDVSWDYFNCNYNECPISFFKPSAGLGNNEPKTAVLLADIKDHKLPDVSFVMPDSDLVSDGAPSTLSDGQNWVESVIHDLNSSGYLPSTVVLLTWDESGGWYDHAQPSGSLGYRVPMIMIAPYGPVGVVDNALASHYSIPKVIESVFDLSCLHLDCGAYNLLSALSPTVKTSTVADSSVSVENSTSTETPTACQAWATAYWGPFWGCESQ